MTNISKNYSWRAMCISMAIAMVTLSVTSCNKQGGEGASTASTISPPASSSGPAVATPAEETEAEIPSVALKLVRADGVEIDLSSKPIPLSVSVKAVFSAAMDKQSVESAASLVDPDGKPVDGAFSWSADDKEMSFAPNKALKSKSTYAFNISADAVSAAAKPIEAVEQSFLTMTEGDVTGDGFPDFLVGSPGYNANSGAAILYSVELDYNNKISDKPITTIVGVKSNFDFGKAVAVAGDLDADGYADIIVGAPGTEDSNNNATGAVYFFSGRHFSGKEKTVEPITAAEEADVIIYGKIDNQRFGGSLLGIGDINADGFGEFLVGTPQLLVPPQVYVFIGKKLTAMKAMTTDDASSNVAGEDKSLFGHSMAMAGDVDGDGIDEIIISAPWKEKVYLFKTNALKDNIDVASAICMIVGNPGQLFGKSVSAAGDLDGDGFADILIGAPGFMGPLSNGAAYVFSGKKISSSKQLGINDRMVLYIGANETDFLGFSVVGGMDINGDGKKDIALGVPGNPGTGINGKGMVLYHSGADLNGQPLGTTYGLAPNDRFGSVVTTLGDLTEKGKAVIVVSAPGHNSGTGNVKIFVPGAVSTLSGTASGDAFGEAISADIR